MSKAESRINIITSPGFIKVLKIIIAVLSCLSVLSIVMPVKSSLIRSQQINQLEILEDSITDVSGILMKISLEFYTAQDFVSLREEVDEFLAEFKKTKETLSRLDQAVDIQIMEEYLNPRLVEITTRLCTLNETGVLDGFMPLIERKYTIRNRGFQDVDNWNRYVVLSETIDDLKFFLMHVVGSFRYEIASSTAAIKILYNISTWQINIIVILILLTLILVALLISAKKLQQSKLAEESALDRSESLEELVKARTADLMIQNLRLVETRDLLVEKEKMAALGQVVAGVAHEVNTPLGVCVTAASFLSEKLNSGSGEEIDLEDLKEITRIIEMNISRAATLIQGFKKVAVDETEDIIRDFDLVAYLRDDLIPSLTPLLQKKGHIVLLKGPEICRMHSYPGSVAQVVTNLVLNASVHGYGEVRGETITVDIRESEHRVQMSISDQGVGMDSELESHIFEPFFTTNKEKGSSGLGMMIIYNLVHGRLGGSLRCNTSPGDGTEFIIDIPQVVEG